MARKRMSMRERISVEMPTYTVDDYGQKRIDGYVAIADEVPANWEHTGGAESFRGRQIQANIIGVFTIRNPRGYEVKPNCRIVHINEDQKAYEVYSARPFEGMLEGGFDYMEVFVRAIDDPC